MSILTLIELAALPLFILEVIGFALCVVSLIRATLGRRKIPYVSLGFLFVPIFLIFSSKQIAFSALEDAAENDRVEVRVKPEPEVKPKQFVRGIIENVYSNKGASGSSPTEKLYEIEICLEGSCHLYIVAQDSRDSEMYWVSFTPSLGGSYPLGFTKLVSEKI